MPSGELVELSRVDPANAETLRAWLNDPEIHKWMLTGQRFVSAADEAAWLERSASEWAEGTGYRFEIHALDDGRLLGAASLEHVDAYHKHGEVGLFIAPPSEWGKGFGRDTILVLLRFGFEELGLHTLRICAFPPNEKAIALYRDIGFVETGRDREAWLISGAMRDLVRMDMLEDEWRERYGG